MKPFPQDNWKFWMKSSKSSHAGNEASTQNSEQELEQKELESLLP